MKSSISASLWAKLVGRMHLKIGCNDRHIGWLMKK